MGGMWYVGECIGAKTGDLKQY